MSLKNKIFLLGLLPLFFFITLGGKVAYDSYKIFGNSDEVYQSMEYTKIVSDLIHETQKERGASGGFLGGGVSFDRLKSQRGLTDKFHKLALKNLESIKFDDSYKSELRDNLLKYSDLRSDIESKRIENAESVRRYSEIIGVWIGYNSKVAQLSTFGDISASNRTLQSLELVKEFAGKLRAVSTGLISKNNALTDKQSRKIQNLMLGVTISIDSKSLSFSKDALKLKKEFLNSSEWKSSIQSYQIMLAKQSEGNYGINAGEYMKTITAAIDKLNKLIKFQLNETMSIVDEKKSGSEFEMISLACVLGGISLFMIFIVVKISKNLIFELTSISERMIRGIGKISSLTGDVSNSSQELSVSSDQQAASMQETSTTMNEIEAMIKRNTEDARSSSEIAENSYGEVKSGVEKIKKMTSALESISESNGKVTEQVSMSNEKMSEIANIIKGIGDKTQVINDIVFQTKLLSFNASVEAARAGEHGKGFAVVAEEVGNLAQMSGQASTEIYEMLEKSIKSVEKVAQDQKREMDELISESKSNIENGMVIGKDSEEFLTSLLEKMSVLKESVVQISMASEEQSRGVNEITNAIQEVNDSTRTNSDIANKTSNISSDLNQNILDFNTVVEDLEALISLKKEEKVSHNQEVQPEVADLATVRKEKKKVLDFDQSKFEDFDEASEG